MNTFKFSGSATALITPMNEDKSINYKKFKELVSMQIDAGCGAVVVGGTTGESATLTDEEKCELTRCAVAQAKGRVPVITGSGSNDTNHCIALSKMLAECHADALLIVTPYYNKTSQKGLFEHYRAVCKHTILPVIVYNVPSRTGMTVTADTYSKLTYVDNICGIKEASGSLTLLAETIEKCGDRFKYYCGNDDITLPFLSLGGDGVISVLGNLFPKVPVSICNNYFSSNINEAANIQLKHTMICSALFSEVNPMPIKFAMNALGMNVGPCRLPLTKVTEETEKIILNSLKYLGEI